MRQINHIYIYIYLVVIFNSDIYILGSKNKMAKLRTKKAIFQSHDKSKNQDLIFA